MQKTQTKKAFTLLEILLVVAAISILAGIVIVAINPTKQLGDTRNAQRKADVTTILNAVYQYAIDNNGNLPSSGSIPTSPSAAKEICISGQACAGGIQITELDNLQKYLVSIPRDPSLPTSNTTSTGYFIVKTANSRVTVSAPGAENSASINATR